MVLHRFRGVPNDGAYPNGLARLDGKFYGTTNEGGSENRGTVFEIDESGRERVLHNFRRVKDGVLPFAVLTAVHGGLYGTTDLGGANDQGTIFEVSTSGEERVLYSFKGISGATHDGAEPRTSLIDVNGVLYGTTSGGGTSGWCGEGGTVFAFDPVSRHERVLYRFRCGKDGNTPGDLIAVNGKFYGTTVVGGNRGCGEKQGCGVVFEVSGADRERVLYRFRGQRTATVLKASSLRMARFTASPSWVVRQRAATAR